MKTKDEILNDEFTRKWGNSFFGCAEGYTGEQFAQTAYPLIKKSMQTYADQECAAKDAEIAELKRRVEELEQNAPKLVLPSVEEMRKYLNGYFGFGGDPSISDREYGFEHGYDYTIDEIKRLNGI